MKALSLFVLLLGPLTPTFVNAQMSSVDQKEVYYTYTKVCKYTCESSGDDYQSYGWSLNCNESVWDCPSPYRNDCTKERLGDWFTVNCTARPN